MRDLPGYGGKIRFHPWDSGLSPRPFPTGRGRAWARARISPSIVTCSMARHRRWDLGRSIDRSLHLRSPPRVHLRYRELGSGLWWDKLDLLSHNCLFRISRLRILQGRENGKRVIKRREPSVSSGTSCVLRHRAAPSILGHEHALLS